MVDQGYTVVLSEEKFAKCSFIMYTQEPAMRKL